MSELDNLKHDAENYAKDHPQQVQEGEHAAEREVESKFGLGGGQDQGNQGQDQNGQQDQDQQDQQDQQ